jgi:hypothetical protein
LGQIQTAANATDQTTSNARRKQESTISDLVKYLQDRKANTSKRRNEKYEFASNKDDDFREDYESSRKGMSKMELLINAL